MSAAAEDILAREEQRYQAQIAQDAAALGEILDDSMIYTHNNGKVDSKDDFIRLVQAIHYREIRRENVQVMLNGDTAVVTGVARITVDRDGETRYPVLRFVNVWIRCGTAWKNYLWQATALPS